MPFASSGAADLTNREGFCSVVTHGPVNFYPSLGAIFCPFVFLVSGWLWWQTP